MASIIYLSAKKHTRPVNRPVITPLITRNGMYANIPDNLSMKKRVVAVVAVIVLLVGASVASIIYMKSGKNDGSKTAYIYRDNELLRTVSLDDVKNPDSLHQKS